MNAIVAERQAAQSQILRALNATLISHMTPSEKENDTFGAAALLVPPLIENRPYEFLPYVSDQTDH